MENLKKRILSLILLLSMLAVPFSAFADEKKSQACCDLDRLKTFEEFLEEKRADCDVEVLASSDADSLSWNYSSALEKIRDAVLTKSNYVSFDNKIYAEDMYMIDYIRGSCLGWNVQFDYSVNSKGYVRSVDLYYDDDFDMDNAKKFYAEVDKILMLIEPDMTDLEKLLVVHDYMALNYEYDYDNYINDTIPNESYTANGIIVNKTGVCQAYAEAYMAIMAMLDVPCQLITSDDMWHAWNLVRLDGDWYHVDVTWDDPVLDEIGRVRHEYFLFSDNGAGDVGHYGWESDTVCDNEQYDDAFWKDIDSKIVLANDKIYYFTFYGLMCKKSLDDENEALLLSDYHYSYNYGLEYCNGELYYLDTYNRLTAVNINTLEKRNVDMDISSGYEMTGFYMNGKDITYCLEDNDWEKTILSKQIVDEIYVNAIHIEIPENIYVGKIYDVKASVKPSYADSKELEWSVSDESVMTVTQDGKIKALKEGVATLTATATDGSGIYKTVNVVVSQPNTVPVADVVASRTVGMVAKGTRISLATDTVGATIYYTTDGTKPTAESSVYTEPIEITESTVIKAIALKEGRKDGGVCEFEYTVAVPKSMSVTLTDYGYMLWNSGKKNLSAVKLNINNSEGVQNVTAIMAVYENGKLVQAFSKDLTADGSENEIIFEDMNMGVETSKTYAVKVFVFGKDYPMFPFGVVNEFTLK